MTDYMQTIADRFDIDRADVDNVDLVAWALGIDPETLYSCNSDEVLAASRPGVETDMEVWASLQSDTREAALVIAAMNQRRSVDIITMGRIAEHMAPDDPVAVLCLWGVLPPPPHVWTEEQTKALHLCARTSIRS